MPTSSNPSSSAAPSKAPDHRAVIDLGTNTFHLLIAEVSGPGLRTVYRERRFVKLAQNGIARIGPEPFARGLETLKHFRKILDEYNIDSAFAFGTAALRTASNGPKFVAAAADLGLPVTLIPGDEEARLITRGVLGALPALDDRVVIMDIGGGSTEFIIADAGRVHWRRSFPIGVLVLFNNFQRSDPINDYDLKHLKTHLNSTLEPLRLALAEHAPVIHLVGAAGTFDVLVDLFATDGGATNPATFHPLSTDQLRAFHDRMLASTLAERLADPDIPDQRAELMVVAMVLIQHLLDLLQPTRITVSDWAMKEGILLESLDSV